MKKIMISAILAAAAMGASAGQAVKSPIFTDELGTTVLTADPSKVVSNVNGSVYTDELGTMVEYSNPTQSVGNVANASAATASAPSKNKGILSNTYGEIGYGNTQIKADGLKFGAASMVRLTVGKELTPNFALEGQVSAGTSTNSITPNVGVKVDSIVGAFAKAKYDVTPQVEVFGKVGYARVNATAHIGNVRLSAHDNDVAYAAGAKYALTKTSSIGMDYTQYGNDSSLSTTMVTYQLKF